MGAQLAMLAGCRVVATCGSQRKAERLRGLGIHRVINYREEVSSNHLRHQPTAGGCLLIKDTVSERAHTGAELTSFSLVLGATERGAAISPESVFSAGCQRGAQRGIPSAD